MKVDENGEEKVGKRGFWRDGGDKVEGRSRGRRGGVVEERYGRRGRREGGEEEGGEEGERKTRVGLGKKGKGSRRRG